MLAFSSFRTDLCELIHSLVTLSMAGTAQAVPQKSLADWHTPQSRTDTIQELIHGVGRSTSFSQTSLLTGLT